MDTLWQDLRYGARMLVKQPGFTLIAALTLALAIGANTAIFSVVDAVLLRPLPFPESEQLVRLYEKESVSAMASERLEVAPANFLDWQRQSRTLAEIAAWGQEEQALSNQEQTDPAVAAFVSANFFSVLGVRPLHGRVFTPEEDQPGREAVALLGHGLWQRRFGGDVNVAGQRVKLDGSEYTVIGVMPAGFQYPRGADIWMPLALNLNQTQTREAHFLQVIARRRPAATLAQVRAEMATIAEGLAQQYPATNKAWTVNVVSLFEDEVGQVRPAVLLLAGAVGLVLLIACANVCGLLLARGATRRAELTVRAALGASRARLVRQLLTESALLAGLGGGLGLLLAVWGVAALLAFSPPEIPRLQTAGADFRVLGFSLAVTALTGLLFGLVPALQVSRFNLGASLKEAAPRAAGSHSHKRSFEALVVAEIALALVVLAGAGLLVNSVVRLQRVDLGFQPANVLTLEVNIPSGHYSDTELRARRLNFYGQALEHLAALPGVTAVGAIDSLPLSGDQRAWTCRQEGQNLAPSERPVAGFQVATVDYFRAMGMQLRRGRGFTEADRYGAGQVMIVNESFARRYYPNEEPLGRRILIRDRPEFREIIGVVSDIRHFGPDQEPAPEMYVPYNQFAIGAMPLVVHANVEPEALSHAVRKELQSVDREVAIGQVRTMTELLSSAMSRRYFALLLLALFAAVAVLLAAIGVYGVMSYAVAARTHELGIRVALGATPSGVLRLLAGHGAKLTLIGVATGLGGAFAATRWMKTLLFGVSATDPLTFAGIALLLTAVALLACYVPARRATKVDPMVALRCE